MTLVLFGAGNIGRSFIGPVFSAAGYEVVFVDISDRIIAELNRRNEYQVVILYPDGSESRTTVAGVSAIDARDSGAVVKALATADLAATAVGAGGFGPVCELIGLGLAERVHVQPGTPLDVILAENIPRAARVAREHLSRVPSADLSQLGLVETSIGKMVPIVPADIAKAEPLLVFAEPYNTLIVARQGFVGTVPQIENLMAVDNIQAYVDRKLFVHNLGHAAVAYVGNEADSAIVTIAEAVSLPGVREPTKRAMLESAGGLYVEYPGEFRAGDLEAHVEDLLTRFANPALNDTVFRVGRDLKRKLGKNDRIVGAMRLLARHRLPMDGIAAVYRAALGFSATDESGALFEGDREVITDHKREGLAHTLRGVSGLISKDVLDQAVINAIVG